MQIRKLKAKMGFHVLAKHGLNKHGLKDLKFGLIWGREKKTVRRERERKEEEEEQAKPSSKKVWNYMGF